MRILLPLFLATLVLAGCSHGNYGPYSSTYGVPTLAATAAGAAIGYNIGNDDDRGQNAVLGGIIGAMVGTAAEAAINNQNQYEQELDERRAYQQGRSASYRQPPPPAPYYRRQSYQPPAYRNMARVSGVAQLRMRSGPGLGYGIVGLVHQGQPVHVLSFQNGWAQVRVGNTGRIGWVSGRYLTSMSV